MKKDEKQFLEKNSYTRGNVDATREATSARNSKKALIGGGQLHERQRQGVPDATREATYLYIY